MWRPPDRVEPPARHVRRATGIVFASGSTDMQVSATDVEMSAAARPACASRRVSIA